MSTKLHPFRVLISHEDIVRRGRELARRIAADYQAAPPLLVAVIDGARMFARLLEQHLSGEPSAHEIRASSYGAGMVSGGQVAITSNDRIEARGRDLLLIEDIVDTGRTVAALRQHFLGQGARSCRVAALLSKPSRRVVEVQLDYLGYEIPDEFVVGFGMDYAGRFRELPDIVIYESDRDPAGQPTR